MTGEEPVGERVLRAGKTHRLPTFWYEDGHLAYRRPDGYTEYSCTARCCYSDAPWPRVRS